MASLNWNALRLLALCEGNPWVTGDPVQTVWTRPHHTLNTGVTGDLKTRRCFTGGHRTRVAAVTLDNMAEDAVDASASLRQILTVSVRCCGPAFVSWLSVLWDILTRNPELQWFGISPQFRLKFHVATRVSVMSVFQGTRVSVGSNEGTAVYRWM